MCAILIPIMDPTQQPPPPSFFPEFHGWNARPGFGESLFNFPSLSPATGTSGGYSNPVRHLAKGGATTSPQPPYGLEVYHRLHPFELYKAPITQGVDPTQLMEESLGAIQLPQAARGGPISSPSKVVLSPQEVQFCKRLGINLITFARHKLSLPRG
jgi:hypothetical protein